LFADSPNTPNENHTLNQSVQSFVNGKLDETSFRNVLRSNNVDPDIYSVKKFLSIFKFLFIWEFENIYKH
jgi:hypothetical protein